MPLDRAVGGQLADVLAFGSRYPDSPVLFDDDFAEGLAGWEQLYESGGSVPHPGPTLCSYPALHSRHSLRYGTGNVGSGTVKDGYTTIVKRLTLPGPAGKIVYEAWWAWGAALQDGSPLFYEFWLDVQAWDGSTRSNYIVRWYNRDPGTGNARTQWAILDNTQSVVWIPGSVISHGANANKPYWNYVRLIVDLLSGYQTLTAGGQTFDLTRLGAGTGAIAPVADFNGGLNYLAGVTNRPNVSLGQAWGFLGRVRGSYGA